MARRGFFSFHYERDCWRAGQVGNSWRYHERSLVVRQCAGQRSKETLSRDDLATTVFIGGMEEC
jgi:hypothetical protein